MHSQSVDIPQSSFKADDEAKHEKLHKKRRKQKKSMDLNEEEAEQINSKKRKRAQSVKHKRRRSRIKDLDVCKNKVKNSIFKREKGHKKSFDDSVEPKRRNS